MVASKREFLLSLWHSGMVAPVKELDGNVRNAWKRALRCLSMEGEFAHLATKHPTLAEGEEDPLHWIGNERELLFELVAYFFYEFPTKEEKRLMVTVKNRLNLFINNDSDLFMSKLCRQWLSERASPQEVRIRILQHILSICSYYTISEYRKTLTELATRFPHSVPILKALLDVGSEWSKQYFLSMNTGAMDERARLVRTCGRIYNARQRFEREMSRYQLEDAHYAKSVLCGMVSRLVTVLRNAAEKHCDSALPDDYIWVFLMRILVEQGEEGRVTSRVFEEVFTLGQGRCPWSKRFLYEALIGYGCDDPSVHTINNLIREHGLRAYCPDSTVESMLGENMIIQ